MYQNESVAVLEEVSDGTTKFVKIRDPRGDEGYVRDGYVVKQRKKPHWQPPSQPSNWSGASGMIGGRMA